VLRAVTRQSRAQLEFVLHFAKHSQTSGWDTSAVKENR